MTVYDIPFAVKTFVTVFALVKYFFNLTRYQSHFELDRGSLSRVTLRKTRIILIFRVSLIAVAQKNVRN